MRHLVYDDQPAAGAPPEEPPEAFFAIFAIFEL